MTGHTTQRKRRESDGGCHLNIVPKEDKGILSRDQNEVREPAIWVSDGSVFQAEGTVCAEALRQGHSLCAGGVAGLSGAGEEERSPCAWARGSPQPALEGTWGLEIFTEVASTRGFD